MYALFVVLNRTDYLDDVLYRFMEIGISGATIFDTQGMASALVGGNRGEIPILGMLRGLVDSSRPYNKTFFSIVESEELVDKAIDAFNEIVGDIYEEGTGLIFSLPIGKIAGLRTSGNTN